MGSPKLKKSICIGWDVGGWNCDKNPNSRDALVVLDAELALLGTPWRGNLRDAINSANSCEEWIALLLKLCKVQCTAPFNTVLAIDTPLGFSEDFQRLLSGAHATRSIGDSATNPYLFRYTERYLFERGLTPLSAIKDMIGSQATKGMHVLAKFAPKIEAAGVWRSSDGQLTAIEAYPAACKHSATIGQLLAPYVVTRTASANAIAKGWEGAQFIGAINHDDKRDALLCALVAWQFANQPDQLTQPPTGVPLSEGWIFTPSDALMQPRLAKVSTAARLELNA